MSITGSQDLDPFEELFDHLLEESTPDYVEDAYQGTLQESPEPGIAAQTGDIGNQILTGTCLQTPEASKAVKNGVNPVTEEEMDDYEDVADYLEELPDSIATFANQFGIAGMEEGELYIIKEDVEWPEKFAEHLDEAGIDYDKAELNQDVNHAYDQVLDTFETYVTDVLGNNFETELIYTSDIMEEMNEKIGEVKEEHEISQEEGVYEHICLLTSHFGMEMMEEVVGLEKGSLDMIDPKSHHDYLFDLETDESNIFAEASKEHYQNAEEPENNIALTYPVQSPFGQGVVQERL